MLYHSAILAALSACLVFQNQAVAATFPNARFPASFTARAGTDVASTAKGPLIVRPDGTFSWPGVEIRPATRGDVWDWSGVGEVSVVVSNGSDRAEHIHAVVVGEGMSLEVAPARGRIHWPILHDGTWLPLRSRTRRSRRCGCGSPPRPR